MRHHPTKDLEGFELLEDVIGKTGRPIMKKGTLLTEYHLTILQKFLVATVNAAPRKNSASKSRDNQKINRKEEITTEIIEEKVETFYDHYLEAVSEFKKEYQQWSNGVPIDILKVRRLILPLLEQVEKLEMEPFLLYRFVDKKNYIPFHSVAVSILTAFIAKEIGYEKGDVLQIGIAALLSDAGMTKVDQDIIRNGRQLTTKQTKEIHNHPVNSAQMIDKLTTITTKAEQAVLQHHERIDGSGYPAGLKGSNIHPYARIIAVCDTYYALTSPRLYKENLTAFQAIDELNKEKPARLDSEIIQTFAQIFSVRAVGKKVRLSNQSIGEIVYMDKEKPAELLVKLEPTGDVISTQKSSGFTIEDFAN